MKKSLVFALLLFATSAFGRTIPAEAEISVIPQPRRLDAEKGTFVWTADTPVVAAMDDADAAYVTAALDELAASVFGRPLTAARTATGKSIRIDRDTSLAAEAYRLTVTPTGIVLTAGAPAGAFYAVQTLRQLMPSEAFGPEAAEAVEVPCATIEDEPDMKYRGAMLDVARHFFTVDEVKRLLDILALHKMNVFHWHLTDDQGWRIEIRRYPELTRVGSVRRRTLIGRDPGGTYDASCRYDETPHGGFYTQDEIRQVVDYAARRFITVIPEIEFPGHAVAALASYPWLSCTGEQYEVRQTWDIDDRVFCTGKETTFEFMEHVLDEVAELFPGPYVHIGGDECPMTYWKKCPHCKALKKSLKLRKWRELQNHATMRIEKFLHTRGKQLIGWDEILEGPVSPTTIVMSWRGTEGGIRAAKQGNRVIMAPGTYCYFDHAQAVGEGEPLSWGARLPVEKVYSFEPYQGLSVEERPYILGLQANLWTEYIADWPHLQYMLLPRLAALSEVGWTPDRKDYADFLARLRRLRRLYDACGYRYATHAFSEAASEAETPPTH